MSMRAHSHRFDLWPLSPGGEGETVDCPADCDCGDTLRELLAEIAATAAGFALIIALARALG